jgi:phosphoribosyl-ATP pyrophosphohydrolase/phosphoribosyl-AMP cyclohydrolase
MNLDFRKYADGLIPAVVQDADNGSVLMLGFLNDEAVTATQRSGYVTFYSRSKQRLWMKGETSGNRLEFVSIAADCDKDSLLITARPMGPICHTGSDTCFGPAEIDPLSVLRKLELTINQRRQSDDDSSYVAGLFRQGLKRIAQKVGEEAVETIIAAMDGDQKVFTDEAADLLFHYLILLSAKGVALDEVAETLRSRSR